MNLVALILITFLGLQEPTQEVTGSITEVENIATGEIVEVGYSLGEYKLTAYCACEYCCGKSDAITASGTVATAGRTVACNSIPFGTVLSINGHQYIVEDTGGMSDNVIDIFFDNHQDAINFGVQYADVYKVVD